MQPLTPILDDKAVLILQAIRSNPGAASGLLCNRLAGKPGFNAHGEIDEVFAARAWMLVDTCAAVSEAGHYRNTLRISDRGSLVLDLLEGVHGTWRVLIHTDGATTRVGWINRISHHGSLIQANVTWVRLASQPCEPVYADLQFDVATDGVMKGQEGSMLLFPPGAVVTFARFGSPRAYASLGSPTVTAA